MSSAPTKTSPCVQDIDSKEAQYYEAISECSNSYLMRTLKSLEIADDEEIVNVGLEDEFEWGNAEEESHDQSHSLFQEK